MDYKLIFHEHGQCHPDYFQGTPGVQINLYIHNKMTKGQVLDMLNWEFYIQYESIEYTLFEGKGKLIPFDLSEKLDTLLFEIGSKNDLMEVYSFQAPTENELQNNDEVAPFIFSLTSEIN